MLRADEAAPTRHPDFVQGRNITSASAFFGDGRAVLPAGDNRFSVQDRLESALPDGLRLREVDPFNLRGIEDYKRFEERNLFRAVLLRLGLLIFDRERAPVNDGKAGAPLADGATLRFDLLEGHEERNGKPHRIEQKKVDAVVLMSAEEILRAKVELGPRSPPGASALFEESDDTGGNAVVSRGAVLGGTVFHGGLLSLGNGFRGREATRLARAKSCPSARTGSARGKGKRRRPHGSASAETEARETAFFPCPALRAGSPKGQDRYRANSAIRLQKRTPLLAA